MTKTMTKRDLVDQVAAKNGNINKSQVMEVVQSFLDVVTESLTKGERIELRDFGVFSPRDRAARKARNPKTGSIVDVAATKTVAFKLGKEFKARLSGAAAHKAPSTTK
jgi:integration host factor subunit beta